MEDFSQQTESKKLLVIFVLLGALVAVGGLLLGVFFIIKPMQAQPTTMPTSTQVAFVATPMPAVSTVSSIGATADGALNGYYKASTGGRLGVIMDEWFTRTLADYVNGRLLTAGLEGEDWLHLNQQFTWEIMDVSALEDSNFQVAFVKLTFGGEEKCERIELADPENTGDHWRISRANTVSCEDFGLIEKIPTPTSKPAVFVPEVNWEPCPGTYPSHLLVGMTASVSFTPPVPNRVRDDASLNSPIRGELDPGEQMWILDGPRCADGWVWWKVRSQLDGLEGWTSEGEQPIGEDPIYWLVPAGVYK